MQTAATQTVAPGLLALPQRENVVLVMDLVESVRLMVSNEVAVIDHWRGFVQHATFTVLPRHNGRLVKSLGDGIMAVFDSPREAVKAAASLHLYFDAVNADLPFNQRLYLRAGLNMTRVYVDHTDIYGSGVNLAARVASLAGPSETMVTAEVRDGLTDALDAQVEDMGECYLKHVALPVRTYRVGNAGPSPLLAPEREYAVQLQPTVAVIPFTSISMDRDEGMALGDAIADDAIAALSKSTSLQVISRLSTAPFRGKVDPLSQIRALLGADYIVSGSYALSGNKASVRVQLCDCRNGLVLWADGMTVDVSDIFHGQDKILPVVAANVGRVILQKELERTQHLPLSNLESYTLYVSGISKLHRSSYADFLGARQLFEQLGQRHPGRAAPHAMLAKWHLMRILQGWTSDATEDSRLAKDLASRALRCDPENAFALATKGFVAAHFNSDLPLARQLCSQALETNHQEAQAWRMMAGVHSYSGDGEAAVACALKALALSPMDPTRFIFELVVGAAKLSFGQYDEALKWADTSLRGNVLHLPTHRLRVMALAMSGREAMAKEAARRLLELSPNFRVDAFAVNYPGRNHAHASRYFHALRSAGLPG